MPENKYIYDVRCKNCGKLLAKAKEKSPPVQIKCPKCGALN